MPEVVRRKADFGDLRHFWAVAEAGSFGAAARALGMSPSTLTRSVDNLEARLDVKLLARTPQGITLTPAGQTAYDRVLTMERTAAALEMELAGFDRSPRGVVKLSAPDGIAGFTLASAMPEFMRAYPDIELSVDCGMWPDRPLEGEIDVALSFQKPDQGEVITRPIAHFHYDLFAAPSYLDLYGRPKTLAEAMGHPYVHHVAQGYQMSERAAAFQLMTHARLKTNSSTVSFNSICEGVGLGPLPTAALCFAPHMEILDLIYLGPVTMWLTYRRELARSARVKQVTAWLGDVFDQKTQPWFREEYVHPSDFQPELARYLNRRQGAEPEQNVSKLPQRRA